MAVVVFFMPESPQWLITQNRFEEARNNMVKIYGLKISTAEINEEIDNLIANNNKSGANFDKARASGISSSIRHKVKDLLRPTFYKPFLIVLTYFFFLQFSGVFVVIFYAIDIVQAAGVSIDAYIAIVLIGVTRFVGSVSVSAFSGRFGRRPPSIISGAGMTLCMGTLFVFLFLVNSKKICEETAEVLSWLPATALILYILTSTIGFLTVPFALAAEVFPTRIRGLASGLVTCLAYGFNFIIIKVYPNMISSMGNHGVFCFYAVMSLTGTVFVVTLLPETKGKTLAEIEEYFERRTGKFVKDESDEKLTRVSCT